MDTKLRSNIRFRLRIYAITWLAILFMVGCLCPRPEVLFSPDGGVEALVLHEIAGAEKSIDVAMYTFTSETIAGGLVEAQGRGISIRVILDGSQAQSKYSVYKYLVENGIPVALENDSGLMHHKFMIIDGTSVITGSYNFTRNAEQNNDENIVVIRDRKMAGLYSEKVEEMWKRFTR